MRKLIALVACLTLVLGVSAFADEIAKPVAAKVYLNIDPNIAIRALTGTVDGGSLQMGDAAIDILFRVDANTQAVELTFLVTPRVKGNDPTNVEVAPLQPVGGLQIDPTNANEILGGDGFAQFAGAQDWDASEGLFPGLLTEAVIFESSQDGHFSQDVTVTAKCNNSDPEKPTGEYSGYVVLWGAVVE
jgi:hypothetical protein